jgi:hypothetical protein
MLERGEADAFLIVGSDSLGWLSPMFDSERRFPEFTSPGRPIAWTGSPCRWQQVLTALYPSDEQVISDIRNRVKSLPAA